MRRVLKGIFLASFLATSVEASASPSLDGNSYLSLTSEERTAYVVGLLNGMQQWGLFAAADSAVRYGAQSENVQFLFQAQRRLSMCTADMTAGQVVAIFEKHLSDNPAKRHVDASNLFFGAIMDACPK